MSMQVVRQEIVSAADMSSPAPTAVRFQYSQTESFPALLHALHASLVVTTYQANKLLVVRATRAGTGGLGLSTLVRTFERPMGVAVAAGQLALGTRNQVWLMRNAPDIAGRVEPAGQHDGCFLPRSCHVTGDIGIHEMAWVGPPSPAAGRGQELWIVNTRFSCLCTLHPDYSFVPRWRPKFISALAPEDRCHLNGVAIVDGRPKYASALGESDSAGGWRANKPRGGCLIDVDTSDVIARGLSMPHSPRRHDRRLWLLESGTGRLLLMDVDAGRGQPVAEMPGFARGMAL